MTMNIFERASRARLRFDTKRGVLGTDRLWDLSAEELNDIYIEYEADNQVNKSAGVLSSTAVTEKERFIKLRLEILKHMIESKVADKQARVTAAQTKAQNERIANLIADKKDQALTELSVEQLEAMLA